MRAGFRNVFFRKRISGTMTVFPRRSRGPGND
jgi:hypothetical protein